MRTFKWIGLGCFGVALLLVAVGFALPTSYLVEDSILIGAPSAAIHPHVSDLRMWEPWAGRRIAEDTSLVLLYEGPSSGVGARRTWRSEESGSGSMVITRSHPDSGVWLDTLLEGSLEAQTSVHYERTPEGTRVVYRERCDVGMPPAGGFLVLVIEPALERHFQDALETLRARVLAGAADSSGVGGP